MVLMYVILGAVLGAGGGAIGTLWYRKKCEQQELGSARDRAEKLVREAVQGAEQKKREMLTEAREEALRMRHEAEQEVRERRTEVQRAERRLQQKEENLDRKLDKVSRKEEELKTRNEQIDERLKEVESLKQEQVTRLEEIAALTREEAKNLLLAEVEEDANHRIGLRLKELEEKARREAQKKAREIVVTSIQRCAVEHTSEVAVSAVTLPGDDMKGRIIGREGRNIRAFETLTGVDLIVDDTPEAVTISSFDPIRREVARLSLERLVADGRIHPARIEELIDKAKQDVDEMVVEAGEEALLEANIKQMNSELVKIIGTLRFRSSYGQNALRHSLEVSHVAGIMAAELGLDEALARRAGLLHDIGKAVDHNVEGPHALIGADLARRYGEDAVIVHAIAAHHEDEEVETVYDVLVAAADAVSAARPGARRESLDAYVKRLEKLETLAKSFQGVSKAFAIQAGREIRVMVGSGIKDEGAIQKVAYDVARKIEDEMKYPGQIKVTVIKESRAVDYAK